MNEESINQSIVVSPLRPHPSLTDPGGSVLWFDFFLRIIDATTYELYEIQYNQINHYYPQPYFCERNLVSRHEN